MNSDKVMKGFAFVHDAHLAALYAKRRELGRNDLTEEERSATIAATNARIKAGEDPLDILEEYTRLAEKHWKVDRQ